MTPTTINALLIAASTASGCNHFGIGTRYVANWETDVKAFPFCWIYNIGFNTKIIDSAVQVNTYNISGQILNKSSIDEDPIVIQNVILALMPVYQKFIDFMAKNHDVVMNNIRAVQVYHVYDDNLVGVEFSFNIEIPENITYSCP